MKDWGNVHINGVIQICLTKNHEKWLLSIGNDMHLKKWNLRLKRSQDSSIFNEIEADGDIDYDFGEIHNGKVNSIAISYNKNKNILYSVGDDMEIKQYNLDSHKFEYGYKEAHSASIKHIQTDPTDKYLFTFGEDLRLKQWIFSRRKNIDMFFIWKDYGQIHEGMLSSMLISENGKILYTTGDDQIVKKWNVKHNLFVNQFAQVHKTSIISIAQLP